MDLFTWKFAYGLTVPSKPNLATIAFGDGYDQQFPLGLQQTLRSFPATVPYATSDTARAVIAFLDAHAGITFGILFPVSGGHLCVRADKWQVAEPSGGLYHITISFREVQGHEIILTEEGEGILTESGQHLGL